MDAIHICLSEVDIDREKTNTEFGGWDLYAASKKFVKAVEKQGFASPAGAAQTTDSRFRVYLRVTGRPKLTGVYYVGGWLDVGQVHLSWDDEQGYLVPRRREAVLATKAKLSL